MRKGLLGAFGFCFLGVAPLFAQGPTTPPEVYVVPASQYEPQHAPPTRSYAAPATYAEQDRTPAKPSLDFQDGTGGRSNAPVLDLVGDNGGDTYRFWVRTDYLLWWVKGSPQPPLVTTGNASDKFPGALGQPSTRVLFGGSDVNYGATSGFRMTLGGWADPDRTTGLEVSGFLLQRQSTGFGANSDAAGIPPLYVPLVRADLGREGVYRVADPVVGLNGSVNVASQMRLWGAEGNGVFNLMRRNGMSVDGLFGFRYLDLAESLGINTTSNDFINQITDITQDRFGTRNQFYGGQLGLRAGFQSGRMSFDISGKVALGANHQTVEINGNTTENGVGAPVPNATFPGGILSQPSNMGRTSQTQFGVIPEVQLKLGYLILPNLRASVGYDFIYWNQVVRPGSQIDRNINPTQSMGGTLVGTPAPVSQFNRTDFWAQGVSFALEMRY